MDAKKTPAVLDSFFELQDLFLVTGWKFVTRHNYTECKICKIDFADNKLIDGGTLCHLTLSCVFYRQLESKRHSNTQVIAGIISINTAWCVCVRARVVACVYVCVFGGH